MTDKIQEGHKTVVHDQNVERNKLNFESQAMTKVKLNALFTLYNVTFGFSFRPKVAFHFRRIFGFGQKRKSNFGAVFGLFRPKVKYLLSVNIYKHCLSILMTNCMLDVNINVFDIAALIM